MGWVTYGSRSRVCVMRVRVRVRVRVRGVGGQNGRIRESEGSGRS